MHQCTARLLCIIATLLCGNGLLAGDEPLLESHERQLYHAPPNLSLAKQYFLEGKAAFDRAEYENAVDIFYLSLAEDPSSILLNHLIGRAAYEMGDFEEALFSFERALILNPEHVLSRLEKGRTHLALGSTLEAKEEFQRVLEFEIPDAVRENVTRLLAEVDQKPKRNYFSGAVIIAHTWDSNATLGTGSVPLPFAPGLLSDATEEADQIWALTLVGNHQYMLSENVVWRNGAVIYVADNHDISSNDIRLCSCSTGLQGSRGDNMFDLTFSYLFLELDKELYQTSERGSFSWFWRCYDKWLLKFVTQVSTRHHFVTTGDGSPYTQGLALQNGLGFTYSINEAQQAWAEATYYFDRSPDSTIVYSEYRRSEARAGYSREIGCHWHADATVKFHHDQHLSSHSVYTDRRRKDNQWLGGLSFVRSIGSRASLSFSAEYVKNNSNIPMSDYHSWRGTISVLRLFG